MSFDTTRVPAEAEIVRTKMVAANTIELENEADYKAAVLAIRKFNASRERRLSSHDDVMKELTVASTTALAVQAEHDADAVPDLIPDPSQGGDGEAPAPIELGDGTPKTRRARR